MYVLGNQCSILYRNSLLVIYINIWKTTCLERKEKREKLPAEGLEPRVCMKGELREAGCCGGLWHSGYGDYSQTP